MTIMPSIIEIELNLCSKVTLELYTLCNLAMLLALFEEFDFLISIGMPLHSEDTLASLALERETLTKIGVTESVC